MLYRIKQNIKAINTDKEVMIYNKHIPLMNIINDIDNIIYLSCKEFIKHFNPELHVFSRYELLQPNYNEKLIDYLYKVKYMTCINDNDLIIEIDTFIHDYKVYVSKSLKHSKFAKIVSSMIRDFSESFINFVHNRQVFNYESEEEELENNIVDFNNYFITTHTIDWHK